MNTKIKELIKQAGLNGEDEKKDFIEKFATLIIQECINVANKSVSDDEPNEAWYLIQQHFEIE